VPVCHFRRSSIIARVVIALSMFSAGCVGREVDIETSGSPDSGGAAAASSMSNREHCGDDGFGDPLGERVLPADAAFRWAVSGEQRDRDGSLHEIRMVSQQWQGIDWEHHLAVYEPVATRFPEIALLVLRHGPRQANDLEALRTISRETGVASAFLYDVPNQPLFEGREEDDLLAYTFSRYLRTGDESWPLLFPMASSAVRSMDVVQAVSTRGGRTRITRFVVAGHSKRGQSAWLAGPRTRGSRGSFPWRTTC
jgi:hypothetical protein